MAIVQNVWFFFQDQILGMKWLNALIGNLLTALGLDISSRIGGAVQFFLYDTIKIFVLLSVLIFVISYIQSYFPPERTKKILGRFHGIGANTLAALLGTVTPFCSCSSIPLFIGFTGAGLPLGVTFSFLISSPLVDLGTLVLLTSIFGGKVAIAYVIVGLVLAVLGGSLIEHLHLENEVEEFIRKAGRIDLDSPELSLSDRLEYAKDQVVATVKKVAPYIFIGVGIGALIHNFIPQSFVETVLGGDKWYSVPLATLVGVPMYADIFGTIPVAESLFAKGAGLGTILSFMMAVTALSLPSMIMLRKAVKPKLLAVFFSIVTVGIMLIGFCLTIFLSCLLFKIKGKRAVRLCLTALFPVLLNPSFSCRFMMHFGIPEKERNRPDTSQCNQGINNTADHGCLTAKQSSYQVKLKNTDASPVECADYYQRKYQFINHNNISLSFLRTMLL